MELMKEILKTTGKDIKTPQFLCAFGVVLFIFKQVFNQEFSELFLRLGEQVGIFEFITDLIQLASILLFISSILVFIACVMITVTYAIVEKITEKKKYSEDVRDLSDTMHRFLLGSYNAVMDINMWLFTASCYFITFNESGFMHYYGVCSYALNHSNAFVVAVAAVYGIFLIGSFFKLLNLIMYKFLYLRLSEETEKRIYRSVGSYSA